MTESPDRLGFKIVGDLESVATQWVGHRCRLVCSCAWSRGGKVLPPKRSSQGPWHGQMVESCELLSALGGECIDDMRQSGNDEESEGIHGFRLAAVETARQRLDALRDEMALVGERGTGGHNAAAYYAWPSLKGHGRMYGILANRLRACGTVMPRPRGPCQ